MSLKMHGDVDGSTALGDKKLFWTWTHAQVSMFITIFILRAELYLLGNVVGVLNTNIFNF